MDTIGTAGSKWDSLLLYFQDDSGWGMIEKVTKDQNIEKNPQAIEYMERELEKSILNGVQCKIHIIPEGRSVDEFWKIFSVLTKVGEPGDQMSIDITHGFRTIPFFMLLSSQYLKLTRNIQLGNVYYGFLDRVEDENNSPYNKRPIIELTTHMQMLDWIQAVNEFQKYGNTRPMTSLLSGMKNKSIFVEAAEEFQTNLQFHQSQKLYQSASRFISEFKKLEKPRPLQLLGRKFLEHPKRIRAASEKSHWLVLLTQAEHYRNTNQVSLSVLSLWEAIVHQTAKCLKVDVPINKVHSQICLIIRNAREVDSYQFLLKPKNTPITSIDLKKNYPESFKEFFPMVNELSSLRNSVAHSNNKNMDDVDEILPRYGEIYSYLFHFLKSNTWADFMNQYKYLT